MGLPSDDSPVVADRLNNKTHLLSDVRVIRGIALDMRGLLAHPYLEITNVLGTCVVRSRSES